MAFETVILQGDGTAQLAVTNDATTEAVVNSLMATNSSAGELVYSLLLDGQMMLQLPVAAHSNTPLAVKPNIPAGAVLTVQAPAGLAVTLFVYRQSIDLAAGLTAVQAAAAAAATSAARAAAALPAGALDDDQVAADRAWSSQQIDAVKADRTPALIALGAHAGGVVIDVSAGPVQRLTIAGDAQLTLTGWPAAGVYAEVEIELIDAGAYVLTLPPVSWLIGDGSRAGSFADTKIALQESGGNTLILWSSDGGVTVSGVAG